MRFLPEKITKNYHCRLYKMIMKTGKVFIEKISNTEEGKVLELAERILMAYDVILIGTQFIEDYISGDIYNIIVHILAKSEKDQKIYHIWYTTDVSEDALLADSFTYSLNGSSPYITVEPVKQLPTGINPKETTDFDRVYKELLWEIPDDKIANI